MPRYLFVLPDMKKPTGGINVALQIIDILRADGIEAAPVFGDSHYEYPYFESAAPTYFFPDLAKLARQGMSTRRRLKTLASEGKAILGKGPAKNRLLEIAPDDVFVFPEVRYPEYSPLFRRNRRILLAQDVILFCSALARDRAGGDNFIDEIDEIITTSEASQKAVLQFSGRASRLVKQSVFRPGLAPGTPKKRQIIYMPRKRADEVAALVGSLKDNAGLSGWTFRAIENVSAADLDQLFSESLIFPSFSQREGFGLPPAEAMAAGCIVIGYTGVGGEEYFTRGTGIPVADSDICAFADALTDTVREYERDPARLDALRMDASEFIAKRYNPEQMRVTVLAAWREIGEEASGQGA